MICAHVKMPLVNMPSRISKRAAVAIAAVLALGVVGLVGLKLRDRAPSYTAVEHLDRARAFAEKGNDPAVIIEAKNVLLKDPQSVDARVLLGEASVRVGQGREAEIALKQARQLGADERALVVPLGRALLLQGDFKRVLAETLPDPTYAVGTTARIHAIRGEAELELGRFDDAAQSYKQALAFEPALVEALVGQARIAIVARNYDGADALLQQVLEKSPDDAAALIVKADLQRFRGKSAEAIAAYQQVLDRYPHNLAAHVNLASLEIISGQLDEAAKHIQAVRTNAAANVMAAYLHALLEYRKRNYTAARESIQKVLAATSEHLPSVLLAGSIEYAAGNNEQAEKYLRRGLAIAPNAIAARRLLIATLLRAGKTPQAIEMVQAAVQQAPNDPAVLSLAGETYVKAKDFAKASQYFSKAVALDPKNSQARTRLGISRLGAGDTERAMDDLESVIALETGDYDAELALIVAYMGRHDYDQAMKAVGLLERKQPENPITFNFKGGVYLAKKNISEARAAFEKALALNPVYVPAATNLARIDLSEGHPEAARKRYEAILEKDPKNLEAPIALVDLLRVTGAPASEVMATLDRAAAANPESVRPRVLIARYALSSDPKKALEAARQAAALSPNDPDMLDAMGAAQLATGEEGGAQATYGKLVELQPKSAIASFHLASVLARNGNEGGARRVLHRALEIKPDFLEAQSALVNLELKAGNVAEALRLSRQAQTLSPGSPVGYILEGDALMVSKAYLKAAAEYEKAYSVERSGGVAIKMHGAYNAGGKQGTGDSRLRDWLKQSPDDLGTRYYLATVAQQNKQYAVAIEQYEYILKKNPDNAVALNDLAVAFDHTRDTRALATAERAYKLMPNEAAIGDTFGWMLVEQGDLARGLQVLRSASNAAPDSIEIRMHLVQALLKSGDKDKAKGELERVVNLRGNFPQRPEAERLLASLKPVE